MTTATRNRKGSQISIEISPELLQRLKDFAAAKGSTAAFLVRKWIEDNLSSDQPSSNNEHKDLVDIVVQLQEDVNALKAQLSKIK